MDSCSVRVHLLLDLLLSYFYKAYFIVCIFSFINFRFLHTTSLESEITPLISMQHF